MERGAIVGWGWGTEVGCGTSSKLQAAPSSSRIQACQGAGACLGAAQSSAQMWEITRLTDHEITSPGLICSSFKSPRPLDILFLLLK